MSNAHSSPSAAPRGIVPLDTQTFAIGILCLTAVVLFTGLMFVATPAAQALGQSDRGGDYRMLTMQYSNSREALIVTDGAARKMLIYTFDISRNQLEIAEIVPLDMAPRPNNENQPGQQKPGNQPRQRRP